MHTFKKIAFLLTTFILTQCATTSPPASSPTGGVNSRVGTEAPTPSASPLSAGCPLDKMQWLASSKNFDSLQQKEMAKKIALAAHEDAAILDKMVASNSNSPLEITSSLKSVVDAMAQTKTPVSEGFYKQYTNSRMTMCAVFDALRNGSIKLEDRSKVAGNTFRDVAQSFEKLTN